MALQRMLLSVQTLRLSFGRSAPFPSVGLSVLPMAGEKPATAAAVPSSLDPALRQQMREELSRLLDQVPSARTVFKALGTVERALGSRRPDALDLLLPALLQEASRQIARLGRTEDGDVLRMLGQRLCLLSGSPPVDEVDSGAFEPGRNVEVSDISLTMFMEVDS
ncbi:hypothetical protein [Ideonella sp. YS5]|uniref:hypothetical protein n=1 Tax=Ideonella sp. YS5 TaxID=3453714 RepID=UPI003F6F226C